MRIAIITFCNNGNFGSELQALAMNDYLVNRGHTPVFCILKSPNKLYRAFEKGLETLKIIFFCATDSDFRDRYKSLKENITYQKPVLPEQRARVLEWMNSRIKTIRITPNIKYKKSFDCYVCGSDQIWSPNKLPVNMNYFLSGIPSSKKIAYAPSFGSNSFPTFFIKKVFRHIADFKHLSVRESDAASNLAKYGINAKTVIDPTLLMGSEYWKNQLVKTDGGYCVCYFLGAVSNEVKKAVNRLAAKRKIIVFPLVQNTDGFENAVTVCCNPLEFINYIYNADVVFTDSFHGTVFSVMLEKTFYVFSRTNTEFANQRSRIENILMSLGVEDRLVNFPESLSTISAVDYSSINQKLAALQKDSADFFDSALKQVQN